MKHAIKALTLAVGLVIGSFPEGANAAITFTETNDFDSNLNSPSIVPEPLGIGVNTVTGSLPATLFGFIDSDTDAFRVDNPNGLTVTAITVTVSNFVGTLNNPRSGSGVLRLESPGFDQAIIRDNGQFPLVPTQSNASAFLFRFGGPLDSNDFSNREAGNMDYVVTLNAVPEPSTGLLFGAFALGAALLRRRNDTRCPEQMRVKGETLYRV